MHMKTIYYQKYEIEKIRARRIKIASAIAAVLLTAILTALQVQDSLASL